MNTAGGDGAQHISLVEDDPRIRRLIEAEIAECRPSPRTTLSASSSGVPGGDGREPDTVPVADRFQAWEEQRGRRCESIREDFCGTAVVCMEWVKRRRAHTAVGVDLDPSVLKWGRHRIPQRTRPFWRRPLDELRRSCSSDRLLSVAAPAKRR